jgi:pimeloyl-ACP methyl ester carboxylesterase
VPYYEPDETTSIYYEERGAGPPLLAIAPGGMKSTIDYWKNAAIDPWASYADHFHVVAMDQRNAGRSRARLDPVDPWGAYASDQLGLMQHLGFDRFLVMGCCIGGSFILKLAQVAPTRIVAAVLEQPIGVVPGNRSLFEQMQRAWAEEISAARDDVELSEAEEFLRAMWAGDLAVSVEREAIRAIGTPLLVLPGIDDYHPTESGREIAALAPNATTLEPWKDTPELIAAATESVRRWLIDHGER